MSMGVCSKIEDLKDLKEKLVRVLRIGLGEFEFESEIEYEHLSERRGWMILEFEKGGDEKREFEMSDEEEYEGVVIRLELLEFLMYKWLQ